VRSAAALDLVVDSLFHTRANLFIEFVLDACLAEKTAKHRLNVCPQHQKTSSALENFGEGHGDGVPVLRFAGELLAAGRNDCVILRAAIVLGSVQFPLTRPFSSMRWSEGNNDPGVLEHFQDEEIERAVQDVAFFDSWEYRLLSSDDRNARFGFESQLMPGSKHLARLVRNSGRTTIGSVGVLLANSGGSRDPRRYVATISRNSW